MNIQIVVFLHLFRKVLVAMLILIKLREAIRFKVNQRMEGAR